MLAWRKTSPERSTPGPLAVPDGKDAIEPALAAHLGLLRAPDGGGRKILVEARQEDDVARLEDRSRRSELVVDRAHRRAAIARHIAGRVQPCLAVTLGLHEHQAQDRLRPGQEQARDRKVIKIARLWVDLDMGWTILDWHGIAKRFACSGRHSGMPLKRLGADRLLSFGGPAGQIALMHREIVERARLADREGISVRAQLLHAAAGAGGDAACHLCRLEAAWRAGRACGGPALRAAGRGRRAGADHALCDLRQAAAGRSRSSSASRRRCWPSSSRRCCAWPGVRSKTRADWVIAGLAFLALFVFGLPFPLIIAAAALYGFLRGGRRAAGAPEALAASGPAACGTVTIWGAVWLVPLAAAGTSAGPASCADRRSASSSRSSRSSPSAAPMRCSPTWRRRRWRREGWLSATEMIDGLALAETTPGPLILVTQFVGYLRRPIARWAASGAASPALW